jgi:mannitol/fructose-specific phosphotransferase system IIA component (Ntr-type)
MAPGASLRLLDYIDPQCVVVGLSSPDKKSTLSIMVDMVVEQGLVKGHKRLMEALQQREKVVSTGIGNSVAIPHADLPEISSPRLALGVFPQGVDFDSLDEEPVYIVFLLLGTPRTPGLHMKILARIARLSKDAEFTSGLREARQPDQLLTILEQIESRH